MKQLLRSLALVAGALFAVTGIAQEKINLSIAVEDGSGHAGDRGSDRRVG